MMLPLRRTSQLNKLFRHVAKTSPFSSYDVPGTFFVSLMLFYTINT